MVVQMRIDPCRTVWDPSVHKKLRVQSGGDTTLVFQASIETSHAKGLRLLNLRLAFVLVIFTSTSFASHFLYSAVVDMAQALLRLRRQQPSVDMTQK